MWRTISLLSVGLALVSCKKEQKTTAETLAPATETVSTQTSEKDTVKSVAKYSVYKGAWFDVEYPSNFTVKPSLKSSTSQDGYDSALFTSPDGKVQFYVFSPQWNGDPADIKLKDGETLKEKTEENKNTVLVKRWTIAANDGSYSRSYEERKELENNVNKIFGIRYSTKEDLDRYKEEYLHFKNSLNQYAD